MANIWFIKNKGNKTSKTRGGLFQKINKRLRFVGLLPLIFLAIFSILLLFFATRGSNILFERTLLKQKQVEVERFIKKRIEILQVFVNFDNVEPVIVDDQKFFLSGILESEDQFLELSIIQAIPQEILNDLIKKLEENGNKVPLSVQIPYGVESSRCVRRASGIECMKDEDILLLRNREFDLPFVKVKTGETYVGSVTWEDDRPSMIVAGVIKNKSRSETVGIIVGRLDLTSVQELFSESAFSDSGSVFLADQGGRVISHSGGKSFKNKTVDNVLRALGKKGVLKSGNATVIDSAFDTKQAFTAGLPVIIENQKWFLVAEWPLGDAFFNVFILALQFVVFSSLLLVVVKFVGVRLARAIVTPIRTVQLGAERIGKGDFSQRIVVNTNDELEELGESINSMSEDLMKLEQVRTAETRARALATAVAKEESLKEEKDVLIATASHQFRTPVTALNWNIELLRNMTLPDDAKGLLEGVAEHTKNLATIASDLLNSTAFGAGYRVVPDAEPVNPISTLDEVLEHFTKDAALKSVTFVKQYSKQAVSIRGSFAAIRIAFEQLISNAIRYSKLGGVVTVRVGQEEDGRASIAIEDTGIGIPEDEQQFLFDAFFRAKNSIVMKNVGTGLGLYIANNIITGHGGLVEFESVENKGTTFTVTLPGMGASPRAFPENSDTADVSEESALGDSFKEE